jgi:Na+-driven multidrug efflux pump
MDILFWGSMWIGSGFVAFFLALFFRVMTKSFDSENNHFHDFWITLSASMVCGMITVILFGYYEYKYWAKRKKKRSILK